ncbi:lipoate--protein ligase family protein [Paenibacillus chitinolyticus]|uniref:lipoate--protein ligase family protein n=1 Tax=Paenibacillus chitinolyticus TaxID=79263 RepID=UPI002DB6A2FC|nr:lipoate--protein ligase family protein [Paenibacillus chitinolyticus]MEC0244808.1 lipoate--protein ligase family protein [Paenibacillus chitinolyticus]
MESLPLLPEKITLLDRSGDLEADLLFPFALEELLIRKVGEGADPIVHLWRHPQGLVLGLRDSRLPYAPQAADRIGREGRTVIVRNSGGAAVPLDPGVVNVTLITPKPVGKIDFHDDFETMYRFLGGVLADWNTGVAKGEIAGSYCPGDFDLSVGGRKFCGIAQRRQARALSVQAFVVVEGTGAEKAAVARSFYDEAGQGAAPDSYPDVEPGRMTSLAEYAGAGLTSPAFCRLTGEWLARQTRVRAANYREFAADEDIAAMMRTMRERYGFKAAD